MPKFPPFIFNNNFVEDITKAIIGTDTSALPSPLTRESISPPAHAKNRHGTRRFLAAISRKGTSRLAPRDGVIKALIASAHVSAIAPIKIVGNIVVGSQIDPLERSIDSLLKQLETQEIDEQNCMNTLVAIQKLRKNSHLLSPQRDKLIVGLKKFIKREETEAFPQLIDKASDLVNIQLKAQFKDLDDVAMMSIGEYLYETEKPIFYKKKPIFTGLKNLRFMNKRIHHSISDALDKAAFDTTRLYIDSIIEVEHLEKALKLSMQLSDKKTDVSNRGHSKSSIQCKPFMDETYKNGALLHLIDNFRNWRFKGEEQLAAKAFSMVAREVKSISAPGHRPIVVKALIDEANDFSEMMECVRLIDELPITFQPGLISVLKNRVKNNRDNVLLDNTERTNLLDSLDQKAKESAQLLLSEVQKEANEERPRQLYAAIDAISEISNKEERVKAINICREMIKKVPEAGQLELVRKLGKKFREDALLEENLKSVSHLSEQKLVDIYLCYAKLFSNANDSTETFKKAVDIAEQQTDDSKKASMLTSILGEICSFMRKTARNHLPAKNLENDNLFRRCLYACEGLPAENLSFDTALELFKSYRYISDPQNQELKRIVNFCTQYSPEDIYISSHNLGEEVIEGVLNRFYDSDNKQDLKYAIQDIREFLSHFPSDYQNQTLTGVCRLFNAVARLDDENDFVNEFRSLLDLVKGLDSTDYRVSFDSDLIEQMFNDASSALNQHSTEIAPQFLNELVSNLKDEALRFGEHI